MRWRSSRILEFPRTVCAWLTRTRGPQSEQNGRLPYCSVTSVVGTLIFLVAYFAIDLGMTPRSPRIRLQNTLLGIGTAFAMLGIGIGIVHWAKALMPDHEVVGRAPRDPHRGGPPGRGPHRRRHRRGNRHQAPPADPQHACSAPLHSLPCRRSAVFGDLGPRPGRQAAHTPCGHRRTASSSASPATRSAPRSRRRTSPSAPPSTSSPKASTSSQEASSNEKAKAVVLLMRLNPDDLHALPGP